MRHAARRRGSTRPVRPTFRSAARAAAAHRRRDPTAKSFLSILRDEFGQVSALSGSRAAVPVRPKADRIASPAGRRPKTESPAPVGQLVAGKAQVSTTPSTLSISNCSSTGQVAKVRSHQPHRQAAEVSLGGVDGRRIAVDADQQPLSRCFGQRPGMAAAPMVPSTSTMPAAGPASRPPLSALRAREPTTARSYMQMSNDE